MAKKNKLRPVSIWGIEFDALIEEDKTLTATIPVYPVEEGFQVSDTIINDPVTLTLTLYVSNTPVTWLSRHGHSKSRVRSICEEIEEKWTSKELAKIVTSDAIYTNMGLTSIAIKHSKETGYSREITITAQKVRITEKKTVNIPADILQSGSSEASGGNASTSGTSAKSSGTSVNGSTSTSSKKSSSRIVNYITNPTSTEKYSVLYGSIPSGSSKFTKSKNISSVKSGRGGSTHGGGGRTVTNKYGGGAR